MQAFCVLVGKPLTWEASERLRRGAEEVRAHVFADVDAFARKRKPTLDLHSRDYCTSCCVYLLAFREETTYPSKGVMNGRESICMQTRLLLSSLCVLVLCI